MGKIWDFCNSNSWEEYQRIQLYKKIGNKLEPDKPKKMGLGEAIATMMINKNSKDSEFNQKNVEKIDVPKQNRCPKCKKGILIVTIMPKGLSKHMYKSFCPVCGHTIKKIV